MHLLVARDRDEVAVPAAVRAERDVDVEVTDDGGTVGEVPGASAPVRYPRRVAVNRTVLFVALPLGAIVAVAAYLFGPLLIGIALAALAVVLLLLVLFVNFTGPGKRLGGWLGRLLVRTRVGRKLARSQLRQQAKRQGVRTVDVAGRPLSDVELQLELIDTPETRKLKNQLKTLNPQQRAQAIRMLQAQMEEAERTGKPPEVPTGAAQGGMPRMSGRPVTRPPRAKRSKKRR